LHSEYLLKPDARRPYSVVPDSVNGVLAFLEQEPPVKDVPRALVRFALYLGWRPRFFGGRLLVFRRLP
jgi:hypothetical protein